MALSDKWRLYDLSTRIALLVEGVKVKQSQDLNAVIARVGDEIVKTLSKLEYRDLSELNKRQVNKLLAELKAAQSRVYSAYSDELIKRLRLFMDADRDANKIIYATANDESDGEPTPALSDDEANALLLALIPITLHGRAEQSQARRLLTDSDALWQAINDAPVVATGQFLMDNIKTFTNTATALVEREIIKTWASGGTVEDAVSAIVSKARQGRASVLDKIRNNSNAMIHTIFAHVSSKVSESVMAAGYSHYRWVSVIDSATTDICRGRNGKVYRTGAPDSPLPPAHIRCRSHVRPITNSNSDLPNESLYTF